ncbi:Wzz/FepE/Etk N-terminal domain-containing protein [Actinoallomurus rhizosphaericola]|uniref:Wzz/FepE/Etk N-terminal domain-containing protein n=1 Tax=Actinoallomurus rhizosphaericola TaxID=2952536 RepID=UPI002090F017|nr:Wzz/FepE/Etk N-terminal domain-containing protein [Actinoallomurus rhizosphaericola]MCO5992797.1 Wzz/FepE/Etk N-terminal domain-containing protein [Actinoallomurus rhizosphaericola]
MDATATGGSRELADYLAMLKRRWWVVVAAAALGVAVAAMLVVVMPKTYSAFTVVNVTPTNLDSGSQSGKQQDINLQTEAQRVRSYDVAERVARNLHSQETPSALSASVSVNVPNNSTVLYITVNAATAVGARDRAHAFAQAYLDDRRDSATGVLMTQMGALQRQINSLSKQLRTMTDKVQKNLVVAQMQALNNKSSDLRVSAANVNPGQIITDARLPGSPSDPSLMRYLPSGFVGGLLLGVVLAILLDRTDKRVRTAQDIERVLDLPVLVDIKRGREGLGLLPARSRTGQSFHELSHVLTATLGHGNHVLLVTGAAPGRGGSHVAANLAAALARTGSDVLLVCADLGSSVAGEILGLPEGPGLSEVLLGWAEPPEVIRKNHGAPTLSAITAGANSELAAELLQREQMTRLIGSLRENYRFTVIEAPSTELGADAQALADLADAAIMVVEVPLARYDQVRDGVRRIDRMGAAVMGAVVLPVQDDKVSAPPPRPLPARTPPPLRERPAPPPAMPTTATAQSKYQAIEDAPTVLDMVAVSDEGAPPPKGRRHRPEPLPPASGEQSARSSAPARSTAQPRSELARSVEPPRQADPARPADAARPAEAAPRNDTAESARPAPADNSSAETAANPKVTWTT